MAKKIELALSVFIGYLWYFSLYLIILPYLIYYLGHQIDIFVFSYLLGKEAIPGFGILGIPVGLIFILIGVAVIVWSSLVLGSQAGCFPFETVNQKELHPKLLAVHGPYGLVRHPMLFGYILALIGGAFIVNSLFSLIWTIPLFCWAAYELIVNLEEKKLLSWFGQDYKNYQQTIPALFPIYFKRAKTTLPR